MEVENDICQGGLSYVMGTGRPPTSFAVIHLSPHPLPLLSLLFRSLSFSLSRSHRRSPPYLGPESRNFYCGTSFLPSFLPRLAR